MLNDSRRWLTIMWSLPAFVTSTKSGSQKLRDGRPARNRFPICDASSTTGPSMLFRSRRPITGMRPPRSSPARPVSTSTLKSRVATMCSRGRHSSKRLGVRTAWCNTSRSSAAGVHCRRDRAAARRNYWRCAGSEGVEHSASKKFVGHHEPTKPPPGFDYDKSWFGPAEETPFRKNCHHYNWRWWYNFGTGDMGNDGASCVRPRSARACPSARESSTATRPAFLPHKSGKAASCPTNDREL